MTRCTSAFSSSLACLSNASVAKPILPSSLIEPFPANGLCTPATLGSVSSFLTSVSISALCAASDSVPSLALKTTWLESPACVGNLLWSRSTAFCDSLPGSEKLSLNDPPEAPASTPKATIEPIQMAMTRRWRSWHH